MSGEKHFLRDAVGGYMTALGDKDDKVVMVNADLKGTCRNGDFVSKFPSRAFNVGIAEQNMVSFAAGLACEGFKPYVFSMAPFLTMRACEQCRTDVAYGKRKIVLIGVYAGVSGGISGATHWGLEDCGIMTSVPDMTVFEVSDVYQAKSLLDYSLDFDGPIYLRVGVEPVPDIYCDRMEGLKVHTGGSEMLCDGNDGAILCSGVTVQYAMAASEAILNKTGKKVRVVDMYSVKPIDREAVASAAKTGRVLAVQDHNVYGGLGSMASMVIACGGVSTKFKVLGINDHFTAMGHAEYLYHKFEIDAEGIEKNMLELMNK